MVHAADETTQRPDTSNTPLVPAELPARLVFFDGECAFCDRTVRWILDREAAAQFHFAPLQGEAAKQLRARFAEFPRDLDTAVLYERDAAGERLWLRSRAVFRIAGALGGAWRAFSWLRVLPAPLTDLAYRAFAASRYRLFGRLESCRLPAPEERARFVD